MRFLFYKENSSSAKSVEAWSDEDIAKVIAFVDMIEKETKMGHLG